MAAPPAAIDNANATTSGRCFMRGIRSRLALSNDDGHFAVRLIHAVRCVHAKPECTSADFLQWKPYRDLARRARGQSLPKTPNDAIGAVDGHQIQYDFAGPVFTGDLEIEQDVVGLQKLTVECRRKGNAAGNRLRALSRRRGNPGA